MICYWTSCNNTLSGRQTKYCSNSCKNKSAVSDTRRGNKEKLVELFGGKCADCSLKGPPYLFDFDHRIPEEKRFGLSSKGHTIALSRLIEEAEKCDMVCANCHRDRTHRQRCSGCKYCDN